MSNIFGTNYPAGAENDPNAPYNQDECECDACLDEDYENCESMSDSDRDDFLADQAESMQERLNDDYYGASTPQSIKEQAELSGRPIE